MRILICSCFKRRIDHTLKEVRLRTGGGLEHFGIAGRIQVDKADIALRYAGPGKLYRFHFKGLFFLSDGCVAFGLDRATMANLRAKEVVLRAMCRWI